jgi:hypothetical protein
MLVATRVVPSRWQAGADAQGPLNKVGNQYARWNIHSRGCKRPFWALGPYIAHYSAGSAILHQLPLSRRPSSLCRRSSGCSDSGSPERKSSRSSRVRPKDMPSRPSGPYSFTARSEVTATLALIPKKDGHHRTTPSYIARLRTRVPTTPPLAVRLSVAAESSGLHVDPIGPGCVAWHRHRAVPQRSVRVPS